MANPGTRLVVILQFIIISQVYANDKVAPLHKVATTQVQPAANVYEALRINLFLLNHDNSIAIADGVYAQYNDNFSDGIDIKDATKLTNMSENFALERDGVLLTLERRQLIGLADTLFFNLTQTKKRNYLFEFVPDKLNHKGLTAFLQDSYLKTSTPVDLTTTTRINFDVNKEAASSAAKRFRVVFASNHVLPLPLTFINVKSFQKDTNINMALTLPFQERIEKKVERPYNRQQFMNATVEAISGKDLPGMMIYPNPVTNGDVNLTFINQTKGIYNISLFNSSGQLVMNRQLQHEEGSNTQNLQINKFLSKGSYILKVKTQGKATTIINVLYE